MDIRFARSPGPGGQNVNKRATRVELYFDVASCGLFSDEQKRRIQTRLRRRMSTEGRLRVVESAERTQLANRRAAEAKLLDLIAKALVVPKARRATRPTKASKLRRLQTKKQRSQTLQHRQSNARPEG